MHTHTHTHTHTHIQLRSGAKKGGRKRSFFACANVASATRSTQTTKTAAGSASTKVGLF